MITTVLLDLDDTILSDDDATELAFEATATYAATKANIDPQALIPAIRATSREIWQEGPSRIGWTGSVPAKSKDFALVSRARINIGKPCASGGQDFVAKVGRTHSHRWE